MSPAQGVDAILRLFSSSDDPSPPTVVPADEARALIGPGRAPRGLRVKGRLDLKGCDKLTRLPDDLSADVLELRGCRRLRALPAGLRAIRVDAGECHALTDLPAGLCLNELNLEATAVTSLPDDLRVDYRLDLSDCKRLFALPAGLKVGSLVLRGCTALRALPSRLDVCFLDLTGCTELEGWPEDASIKIGGLCVRGCTRLNALPAGLGRLAQLDLGDCPKITELPRGLEVSSWIDVANTGLKDLPESMDRVRVRWGRVLIDRRIAFHPELLTAEEILTERNIERRRVMVTRFGFERFLDAVSAEVLDEDWDPGEPRRLLRVPMPDDEPLVCLSVHCPSTGRHYLIRVPPDTTSCRHAAAWVAGFDNPDDYRPIVET